MTSSSSQIFEALKNNNLDYIDDYISSGGNINIIKSDDPTENYYGDYLNLTDFAIRKNSTQLLKKLIQAGLNINEPFYKDLMESPPLLVACRYGKLEIVEFLLQNGANVNAQNLSGCLSLHIACHWAHANYSIAQKLIEYGSNINLKDNFSNTPLHYAVSLPSELKHKLVTLLIANNANPFEKDHNKLTPLHIASQSNDLAIIEQFLQSNSESNHYLISNLKNNEGNTPLHYTYTTSNFRIIEKLIHYGFNINEKNNYGNTLLHLICANDQKDNLIYLLQNDKLFKADITIKDNNNKTPLDLAIEQSSNDCVNIINHYNLFKELNSLIIYDNDLSLKKQKI